MLLGQNLIMAGGGVDPVAPYSIDTRGTDGGLRILSVAESAFEAGDFTYETWIYASSLSNNYNAILGHTWAGGGGLFYARTSGALHFYNGGNITNSGIINIGQWFHVSCVRQSGVMTIYVDGVSKVSGANTSLVTDTNLYVGENQGGNEEFQGYIWRPHVLNVAKYTANFIPQKDYGIITGSLMLIEANATGFTDLVGNVVINNGAVPIEIQP